MYIYEYCPVCDSEFVISKERVDETFFEITCFSCSTELQIEEQTYYVVYIKNLPEDKELNNE